MNAPILLDTHVILWSLTEPEKISDQARPLILAAKKAQNLIISSMTLWEIAMLASKKRIRIDNDINKALKTICDLSGVSVIDISIEIADLSNSLPGNFHGDPSDRIITTTAICNNATLITKDRQILEWSTAQNVQTISS